VKYVNAVSDTEIEKLISVYSDQYVVAKAAMKGGDKFENLSETARIEIGMRTF
jgi:L-arabinose isomerase